MRSRCVAIWIESTASRKLATLSTRFGPPSRIGAEKQLDSSIASVYACWILLVWQGYWTWVFLEFNTAEKTVSVLVPAPWGISSMKRLDTSKHAKIIRADFTWGSLFWSLSSCHEHHHLVFLDWSTSALCIGQSPSRWNGAWRRPWLGFWPCHLTEIRRRDRWP